jgi:hypothetical protein
MVEITPGYPLLIVLFYKLFGISDQTLNLIRMAQMICSMMLVFMIYKISRLFLPQYISPIPTLLVAIYPPLVWSNSFILTESIFTLSVSLFVYQFARLLKMENIKLVDLCILGALLAVNTLIRPATVVFMLIPMLFILIRFIKERQMKINLLRVLAVLLGFIVVMSPWWIRNAVSYQEFVVLSKGSVDPLLAGAFSNYDDYLQATSELLNKLQTVSQADEDRTAKEFVNEIIRSNLANNTKATLKWYILDKFKLLWYYPWTSDPNNFVLSFELKVHKAIFYIGFLGLFISIIGLIRRKSDIWWLALPIILNSLVYQYYLAEQRYAMPFIPYLAIFVGYFVYIIVKRLPERFIPAKLRGVK